MNEIFASSSSAENDKIAPKRRVYFWAKRIYCQEEGISAPPKMQASMLSAERHFPCLLLLHRSQIIRQVSYFVIFKQNECWQQRVLVLINQSKWDISHAIFINFHSSTLQKISVAHKHTGVFIQNH